MRYHHLRYDIWICLLIAFLISLGTVKITEQILPQKYETYVKEHTVADGDIGGKADESVYRAQNVEDLLSHETFTVVSPGIEYRNHGSGYYGSYYMQALTLPSGERVAACINNDSVQQTGETIFDGDNILPVGKIVYEDLTQNQTFLDQIQFKEDLSRTDFYVDMTGNGGIMSEENYAEAPKLMVQVLTVIIAFPILHMIGSKIGIFPTFFTIKKKEQKSEWE